MQARKRILAVKRGRKIIQNEQVDKVGRAALEIEKRISNNMKYAGPMPAEEAIALERQLTSYLRSHWTLIDLMRDRITSARWGSAEWKRLLMLDIKRMGKTTPLFRDLWMLEEYAKVEDGFVAKCFKKAHKEK